MKILDIAARLLQNKVYAIIGILLVSAVLVAGSSLIRQKRTDVTAIPSEQLMDKLEQRPNDDISDASDETLGLTSDPTLSVKKIKTLENPTFLPSITKISTPTLSPITEEKIDSANGKNQPESTQIPTQAEQPTSISIPQPTQTPALTSTSTPTPVFTPTPVPLQANFSISGLRHTENFKKEAPFSSQGEIFKGDSVSFDASGSTGSIVSYEWEFGDGLTATGETVSHTYNAPTSPLIYKVKLTIKDSGGNEDDSSLYIYYIGVPRMLVSLERVPDAGIRNIPCGQTINVKANAYSPWGEITEIKWEIMRGSASFKRESDLILQTLTTNKNHQAPLELNCDMVTQDAALQKYTDGFAIYSFIVREFKDSAGNTITYSESDTFTEKGTLIITSYKP